MIQVAVPEGSGPGQTLHVQTPQGVIAATVPAGCKPGSTFGIAVAPDISTVEETVRSGRTVPAATAVAYANARDFKPSNHTGCYLNKCTRCGNCPIACHWNSYCGGCFCFPLCLFGLIPFPCLCTCEREENIFITRDKHNNKTGAIILVDEPKRTLACYSTKCCSTELQESPCCHCVHLF